MKHFAVVNVNNLHINRNAYESATDLAADPEVIQMFHELFGDTHTYREAVCETDFATPAECRLVAGFFSAFLGTVDELPSNVLLTNLNSDAYYVVHFYEG